MTLGERFLNLIAVEAGDDPTMTTMMTMFSGNILSIPEDELRAYLTKYRDLLTKILD